MARKLAGFGHTVHLISPQLVRPFVKSNRNAFVDAEAICELASRPAIRFVSPKTESQRTLSVLHRVRESTVRERQSCQPDAWLSPRVWHQSASGRTTVTRLLAVLAMQELLPRLLRRSNAFGWRCATAAFKFDADKLSSRTRNSVEFVFAPRNDRKP